MCRHASLLRIFTVPSPPLSAAVAAPHLRGCIVFSFSFLAECFVFFFRFLLSPVECLLRSVLFNFLPRPPVADGSFNSTLVGEHALSEIFLSFLGLVSGPAYTLYRGCAAENIVRPAFVGCGVLYLALRSGSLYSVQPLCFPGHLPLSFSSGLCCCSFGNILRRRPRARQMETENHSSESAEAVACRE